MSRAATFSFFLFTFLYFCSLFWLTAGVPHVFTSPDENANFTFASTFAATGDLVIQDDVNALLHGALHPRSTVVLGALTLPGSFVGWPMIVGTVGRLAYGLGVAAPSLMLLVTPVLVMLALAAWWGIARRLGDVRFAWIATALLALHPAFWYYASRGMMHNVPFVCVLIIAGWCITSSRGYEGSKSRIPPTVGMTEKTSPISSSLHLFISPVLAGLLVGIALCIRTNEALWVLPLAMLLVYKCETSQRAVATAIRIAALLVGITIPLIGLGVVNTHLYGSPFATGYTTTSNDERRTTNEEIQAAAPAAIEVRSSPFAVLLPFGFHPRAMVKNVWHYGMALFPWMTVLAVAGMCLKREKEKVKSEKLAAWRTLLWVTVGLATWLGVVYGSWSFHDNPDPTAMTIGDSHLRYWLPLFALSTLFAARAICSFARAKDVPAGRLYATVPLIAIATLSSILVFGGDDGLVRTRQVLFASAAKRDGVMAATEDNAIIVVDRADKFLFPYRRVLQPLRSDATYAVLADAEKLAPLYYYGIPFPETDMTYLNDVKLASLGLRIDVVQAIGDETLYRISERPFVPQGGN